MRILIVEDEVIVAMDIEAKLVSMGYEVVGIVDNYQDAIKTAKKTEIDLALLDINIYGNKTGVDIAKVFRKKFKIPFVFITAFSNNTIINQVKSTGAYGYVLKPFTQKDLYTSIEIALNKFNYEQVLEEQKKDLESLVQERAIEIEQKEEYYRHLIESLGSGLIVVDEIGTILSVNKAISSLLLKKEDSLINNNINSLLYNSTWKELLIEWEESSENTFVKEVRLQCSGEIRNWCQIWMSKASVNDEFILSVIDINLQRINELKLVQERNRRVLAMVEAEEKERKRIAAEIHDGLGQKLTAAKFTLGALVLNNEIPSKERSVLSEVSLLIEESIKEAREVSHNISPSVLTDYGLEAAIMKIQKSLDGKNGLRINYSSEGDIPDLPIEMKNNLFRIIQEAMNNAVKYSKADLFDIFIYSKSGKDFNIVLTDNGIGFDIEKVDYSKSSGLNNIMERCLAIMADYEIKTEPNKGTQINISII